YAPHTREAPARRHLGAGGNPAAGGEEHGLARAALREQDPGGKERSPGEGEEEGQGGTPRPMPPRSGALDSQRRPGEQTAEGGEGVEGAARPQDTAGWAQGRRPEVA